MSSKYLKIPVRVASVGRDSYHRITGSEQVVVRFEHLDERGELLTRDIPGVDGQPPEKDPITSRLTVSEADAEFFGRHIFQKVTLRLEVVEGDAAECPTCGRA